VVDFIYLPPFIPLSSKLTSPAINYDDYLPLPPAGEACPPHEASAGGGQRGEVFIKYKIQIVPKICIDRVKRCTVADWHFLSGSKNTISGLVFHINQAVPEGIIQYL
jgi:hypothetical protein